MREIKFRAWDSAEKRFWYFVLQDILKRRLSYRGSWDEKIERGYKEQFTGVHDIHGVEIYEGDIVRIWEEDEFVPNHDSGGGVVDFNKYEGFSQLGTISYHESSCVYETKKHLVGTKFDSYVPLDYFVNCEVVGNVHQHLHLLKREDPS